MSVHVRIIRDIVAAVQALQDRGLWPSDLVFPQPQVVCDPLGMHDFSSSCAVQYAQILGRTPLAVAEEIKQALGEQYAQVQIVHPGTLNIILSDVQWVQAMKDIIADGDAHGRSSFGKKKKVVVEMFLIEPTAPISLRGARAAYVADTLARVCERVGYTVVREYVVRDRGRHIDILGESVMRTYFRQQGMNVPYSKELYAGEYIEQLARAIDMSEVKKLPLNKMEEGKAIVKTQAVRGMVEMIVAQAQEYMHVGVDALCSEQALYAERMPTLALKKLMTHDSVYTQDGAQWVKTTEYGDDKDRVYTKSVGEATTLETDIAVCYERSVKRKTQRVIMVLNADERGYERRLRAIPQLLGVHMTHDVVCTEAISCARGGQDLSMLTTIAEYAHGCDVNLLRWVFLRPAHDTHVRIDIDRMHTEGDADFVLVQSVLHRMRNGVSDDRVVDLPDDVAMLMTSQSRAVLRMCAALPLLAQEVAVNMRTYALVEYARNIAQVYEQWADAQDDVHNALNRSIAQCAQRTLLAVCDMLGVDC